MNHVRVRPVEPRPALGIVGLLALVLLHAPTPFLTLALLWLCLWVWQQMFPMDQLLRGSFFLTLAYALLRICAGFFQVGAT